MTISARVALYAFTTIPTHVRGSFVKYTRLVNSRKKMYNTGKRTHTTLNDFIQMLCYCVCNNETVEVQTTSNVISFQLKFSFLSFILSLADNLARLHMHTLERGLYN